MNQPLLTKLFRRPVALSMLYAGILIGGTFALTRLPVELAPGSEFPSLSIATFWPNTSTETVEIFVTAPIEELANTVRGVRKVSSVSREGHSTVSVQFEQKADMNFARLELIEKLAAFAGTLPAGVVPPRIQPFIPEDLRKLQGFLSYSLVAPGDAAEIRKYGLDVVAPQILSIKGVANVEVLGGEQREMQVEISPVKLNALGLDIDRVTSALETIEFNVPVGAIASPNSRFVISVRNDNRDIAGIEQLTIAHTESGSPVRVRDIASVRDAASSPQSFSRINGKPSVTLIIDKEQRINTLQVADAVSARLNELSARLPPGMQIVKESDTSQQMRTELDRLYREVAFSVLCIWLVLVMFLGNVKAPLVLLMSILFSVAGTLLVFWLMGIGLHVLTLAGLVLGFGRLTDDSIVVMDNIQRHSTAINKQSSIALAVSEISLPVVASTLTTVGALLPIAFLPEDLRPYFREFGLAVGISLIMSLLVSFTLIPSILNHMSIMSPDSGVLLFMANSVNRGYQWLLRHALKHKRWVIAAAVWTLGIPLWLLPERLDSNGTWAILYNNTVGSNWSESVRPYVNYIFGGASYLFFRKVPKQELWDYGTKTYIIVSVGFPQGTDIQQYDEIATIVEKQALTFAPVIQKTTTQVRTDNATVRIDLTDSLASTAAAFELKNRLTILAAQTGGATVFVSGFGPGFYTGGETAPTFNVRVLGYNYSKVRELAEEFRKMLERNPRITDVDIDGSLGRWAKSHEVVVNVDRNAIATHGLTVVDVIRAIRTFTQGAMALNRVVVDGERIPYIVKFAGYRDFSVGDLQSAVITNPSGLPVRLSELLSFEERRIPSQISREDQQYVRWISFEYRGPAPYGEAYVNATIKAMPLPGGYRFDHSSSWFPLSSENHETMLWVALGALIIVFMVTASLYESFIKPCIIILSVPFSLIGFFLAFYLTDTPFGRGGYASLILLIGIVVTNAIVLVDYIARQLSLLGPSVAVMISASAYRVKPVLMTTLTTIGGLLPLLFVGDRTSLWYSLALGTIGGLISSTLLTLIIVPIVYGLIHRVKP